MSNLIGDYLVSKKPVRQFDFDKVFNLSNDEIENSHLIDQKQLMSAKIYKNREEYIKTLPFNCNYMELGVAWGYYSDIVASLKSPLSIDLVDWYNQDLKCWSWRKFGECQCEPKHELLYTPETHESYIFNKFSKYKNVNIIKGDVPEILNNINKKYDYVYVDITNERKVIRETLNKLKDMINPGGVIGLNDYLIYDGIIEDVPYGTYQSVNEFLFLNKDWSVDAIALHPLGFYDIYLRSPSE
jgi:hypothetical protein